jgi:replicative DNA helicase
MTTARTRPHRHDDDLAPDELAKLFERLPPRAIETEQALLGSMILAGGGNVHLIGEVMQVISDETELEKPSHQLLFKEIITLYDRNRSIDSLQLIQSLKTRGVIDKVGGADYIIALADDTPIAENAPYYAKLVHDAAQRRKLISAAGRILKHAYESDEQADKLIDVAEREIFEVAQQRTSDKPEQLITLLDQAYQQLDKRSQDGTSLTGLDTGFFDLNNMLAGLQKSEMIILAARPSMGKTAMALSLAEHIGFNNKQPIAIFSLEMSKQQLAERLLSARSGVDGQRMRRNMLDAGEFRKLQEVCSEAYEVPMYIDDTPGISVLEMRTKARRLAIEKDIQAIFVDYMQLMSSPGAESRQQEVSEISRGIKALARELKVPIVALSQLNRNPEGRADNKPLLSDLRESGSIEQDADVVMMLHREEYYHKDEQWALENPEKVGLTELIIAKQRNGPTGVVNLQFDSRTTSFHSRAEHRASSDYQQAAPPPAAPMDEDGSNPPF